MSRNYSVGGSSSVAVCAVATCCCCVVRTPHSREDGRDSRTLRCYNASATHVDVDLLQRRLQSPPQPRRVHLQVAIIDVIPQIGWKVRIHRVLILQQDIEHSQLMCRPTEQPIRTFNAKTQVKTDTRIKSY